ncbi:MAG: hypothetical protein HRU09_14730 [Oligoflexales bacterium]|nr:hypothetical protein [Oligoflexales bacterium]
MKCTKLLIAISIYMNTWALSADCLKPEKFKEFKYAGDYHNTLLHCLRLHNVPKENYNELLHEAMEFNKRKPKNKKPFDIDTVVRILIPNDHRQYTSNKKIEDDPHYNPTRAAPAFHHNLPELYYPRGSILTAALMYGNEEAANILLDFGANPNTVVLRKLKLSAGVSTYRQVTSPMLAGLLGQVSVDMWQSLIAKGLTQLPPINKFEYNLPEPQSEEIKELLAALPQPGQSKPKIDLTELW